MSTNAKRVRRGSRRRTLFPNLRAFLLRSLASGDEIEREIGYGLVELTIYTNKATKEELKEIDRKAAKVEVGTGQLHVLDSRIAPGRSENDTGTIEWIKFEVKLKFHSGMNMTDVLDPPRAFLGKFRCSWDFVLPFCDTVRGCTMVAQMLPTRTARAGARAIISVAPLV